MARRRSRTFQSSRPRRPVEWFRLRIAPTIVIGVGGAVSAAVFDLGSPFAGFAAAVSPTIVRIRGRMHMSADVVGGMASWACGIVQGSVKAVSAGITAIPIPLVDDADWQWFDAGSVGDAAALTSPQPAEDVLNIIVDTKSMRRYEQDDQSPLLVISNQTAVSGDDILFNGAFSLLIKE